MLPGPGQTGMTPSPGFADLEGRMREHLAAFPRLHVTRSGLRHAAVAVAGDAGPLRPIIQVPLRPGRLIHAPTGAVPYQLREVALHGRWTRVAQFDQPSWAWR
jgi:hypothetical protein